MFILFYFFTFEVGSVRGFWLHKGKLYLQRHNQSPLVAGQSIAGQLTFLDAHFFIYILYNLILN